jgi:hypothetical protein
MCVYQEKEKNGLKSESTGLKRARERGERAKEREREREREKKERRRDKVVQYVKANRYRKNTL